MDTPDEYKLLSIEPIKPALLQDGFVDSYVSAAKALLDNSQFWPRGKPFQQGSVGTRSQEKKLSTEGFRWHIRDSKHLQPYEHFRDGLLKEHSKHEVEYIESCDKAEPIKVIQEGVAETFDMLYRMPFLVQKRDFAILVITKEKTEPSDDPNPPRSFLVITVPIDHPETKGYVRARYTSVEECREEIDENPKEGEEWRRMVRWRMAVKSDAGGSIPRIFSEMAMPSKISEDVPSFLSWSKKKFASSTSQPSQPTPASS